LKRSYGVPAGVEVSHRVLFLSEGGRIQSGYSFDLGKGPSAWVCFYFGAPGA
jgi:hypothetical protein